MGSGVSTFGDDADDQSKPMVSPLPPPSYCSWCMRPFTQDTSANAIASTSAASPTSPSLLSTILPGTGSYTRCPHTDCERSLHPCAIPGCPHHACTDAYGAVDPEEAAILTRTMEPIPTAADADWRFSLPPGTSPTRLAKPKRVARADWLCLQHAGTVADFAKASWRDLGSLESYRSLHAAAASTTAGSVAAVGDAMKGLVVAVAAGASRVATSTVSAVASSSAAAVAAVAAITVLEEGVRRSLDGLWSAITSGAPETDDNAMKGVGKPRFGPEACGSNGLPLGTTSSCIVAYAIYKRMPTFRERGFVLERAGHPDAPTVLTIDGFFHTASSSKHWSRLVDALFPNHTWLSLQWDASPSWTPDALTTHLIASRPPLLASLTTAATTAATTLLTAYKEARTSSRLTAYLLADALARLHPSRRGHITILGHSLGASLALTALALLADSNAVTARASKLAVPSHQSSEEHDWETGVPLAKPVPPQPSATASSEPARIHAAILMACPTRASHPHFQTAPATVSSRMLNLYTPHDAVLQALATLSPAHGPRAGIAPVDATAGVANVCCDEVDGHGGWKHGVDVEVVRQALGLATEG
ncbi:hypothetical protein HDU96_009878 [Phlyctochytrium bullatum]|nr:hypothetical protein HDU96_009878 [Phlyctochytrium bullatum]